MVNASFNLSELDGSNGFLLNGITTNDYSGRSVSSAGDVNGDGINDLIIAAPGVNNNTGQTYVIFGRSGGFPTNLNFSGLNGNNGFVINGIDENDFFGRSVSGAGDFNGDGLDDLVIGADGADGNSGETYLIFGRSNGFSASLNISQLNGSKGFLLEGIDGGDRSGISVSSAGDINDDGFDDLIIGAPGADPNGSDSGETYIVFGQASNLSPSLNLSDLNGSNGFILRGVEEDNYSGVSVDGAGDINGDGFDDLIVGTFRTDGGAGESYVVFGKAGGFPEEFELSTLNGSNGFRLSRFLFEQPGFSVSAAGDINGDGIDDLILGTPEPTGLSGDTFVVFGNTNGFPANFNLSTLNGSNGFRLNRLNLLAPSGFSISEAGDINGDDVDDLIIGVPLANGNSGQTYVVFGNTNGFPANLNLSNLEESQGFVLNGAALSSRSGFSVSGAGDINDDGLDDLIIGAPLTNDNTGQTYVVFGNAPPVLDLNGEGSDDNFTTNFVSSGVAVSLVDSTNLTISDPNSTSIRSATVKITNPLDGEAEFLTVDTKGTGNIASSYDPETGILSLSGEDSLENYQQVLRSITYNNTAATPNTTARTIEFIVQDVEANSSESGVVTTTVSFIGNGSAFNLSSLNGNNGFVLEGIEAGDRLGLAVSRAGDINGDGIEDLIIGAPGANSNAGESYLIFGSPEEFPPSFDLSQLDSNSGFTLRGIAANNYSGRSLSDAGDINGDGIDDLIIGAPGADSTGQSYVIFGTSQGFSANLNLSSLDGSKGFKINGIEADDASGISVSSAGDVNGDGIDDLIIGASQANGNAGQSYVLFGKSGVFAASFDMSSLLASNEGNGSQGFVINGIAAEDGLGLAVSGAGDINGDGIDDLIFGAPEANGNAGQSYVLFGKLGGFAASFDPSTLDGSNGFTLNGIAGGDRLGSSVSGAGDINGDGIDDVIIGAAGEEGSTGSSYVVFGRVNGFSDNFDLSSLDGSNGFVVSGLAENDRLGISVSSAGDVNGDGIDDLIVGAYGANAEAGESYLVFGRASGWDANLDLSALDGSNGFLLEGFAEGDRSGVSVSAAGDLNSDGFDDLIIGANGTDGNTGSSYVVFGNASPELDLNGGGVGVDFAVNFGETPVAIVDNDLTITDPNHSNLLMATVSITNPLNGINEFLVADTTATNIVANYNRGTGLLSLSGQDTLENYQQVLRSITYENNAATPNPTTRIIEFVVSDGAVNGNLSTPATTALTFGNSNLINWQESDTFASPFMAGDLASLG
ncbi:MAG: hypothetical protein WA919_08245 [Coleofasciculaceae cyanobacterium]